MFGTNLNASNKPMKNVELLTFPGPDELARAAAGAWLDRIQSKRRDGKGHGVALSGGRITHAFFARILEESKRRAISLEGIDFFWADERCVPPQDPESNFRIARELFLDPLRIRENHIHRIRGEDSPEQAASRAEREIRQVCHDSVNGQPVLDLIFLGMGEDGHVASLFPRESEEMVIDRAVYRIIRHSPKPPPTRITLGYSVIAAAREVWVLISGDGKQGALRKSLQPNGETPLARVIQHRSHTRIFTDVTGVAATAGS